MSYITIAFAKPGSWIGQLIAITTGFKYSHVVLVSPDGEFFIESSGAGPKSGVAVHAIGHKPFDEFRRILHPRPNDVWEASLDHAGKPYDYSYLWGWLFRRDWQDPEKWVCTELIVDSCAAAGRPIIHERKNRVTAETLYMISEPVN